MCAYMKREDFTVSPVYLVALSIVPCHHHDKYLIILLKINWRLLLSFGKHVMPLAQGFGNCRCKVVTIKVWELQGSDIIIV